MPLVSRVLAVLVGGGGAATLVGWMFGLPLLTGGGAARTPMNPATAICLLVCAAALMLAPETTPAARRARVACGLAIAGVGLIRLAGYLAGRDVGIDQILFAGRLADVPNGPNRMAVNTAAGFVATGAALVGLDLETPAGRRPAQHLALGVFVMGLFVLTGYAYQTESLTRVRSAIPMALTTAVAFALVGAAVLAARPRAGFMEVLTSPGPGGASARRLLVAVSCVPWLLGWLQLQGWNAGVYAPEIGMGLFAAVTMIVLATIVWWNAWWLEQLDAERERVSRELAAANKELEAFSYSVSHDLRAPLRAIDGFARILVEDHGPRLDDDGRRVLGVVRENARQMGRLIDDLLAFSRVGRKGLEKSRVDMAALALSVVAETRRLDPERRASVHVGPLLPALADGSLIRQVLVNLVGNAWKFTRGRPEAVIEIGCRRGKGETIYFVKDNGAGFDMRYAGKLFGVFQRLHRAEEFEGTGVGLAIVQRIVQRHGGRVWAEGVVDGGAVFYFALPAKGGGKHESRRRGDSSRGGQPSGRGADGAGAEEGEPR
ncbi:MAG TPA: ATP-binding protein [Candidatus Binatia bacterium]|nr:ATP-binding protein [Candidatus Binatia bacterium]